MDNGMAAMTNNSLRMRLTISKEDKPEAHLSRTINPLL